MKDIKIGSEVVHVNGGSVMRVIEIDDETDTAKAIRINARGVSETAFFKFIDLVIKK